MPLLASSVLLFYAGAAFAYFVVFPLIFAFFTSVGPDNVQVMTDINSYLDFVLKLFLAFGIAFEMPIAAVILIWTGVTTSESLAQKRPYIIVGCFVFGMLLTPPDVISQSLLAIPMWLLFELGYFSADYWSLSPVALPTSNRPPRGIAMHWLKHALLSLSVTFAVRGHPQPSQTSRRITPSSPPVQKPMKAGNSLPQTYSRGLRKLTTPTKHPCWPASNLDKRRRLSKRWLHCTAPSARAR